MLAAYYRGKPEFSLEEIEEPTPKANEVKIKIEVNTICNSTDRKIIMGLRDKVIGVNRVLGHESGGTVVEVGSAVTEFKVGDKVATEEWGTYTKYVCTTVDKVQYVPQNMSFDRIALSEIVMKVYQMAARNVIPGDTVVISGQGAAGLIFTQLAKMQGASKIIVTDLYDWKLEKAREYGADVVINAEAGVDETIEKIKTALNGEEAHVIIEAAGTRDSAVTTQWVPSVYGAKMVQFGVVPHDTPYALYHLHDRGRDIVTMGTCRFADADLPYKRAIQLIDEGKIEVDSFITHRFKLEDINKAFDLVINHPDQINKIVIE